MAVKKKKKPILNFKKRFLWTLFKAVLVNKISVRSLFPHVLRESEREREKGREKKRGRGRGSERGCKRGREREKE